MQDPETIADVQETGCVVVGGGPAGVVLSLLLARQGVRVTLLEAHHNFDRDFRGDTIHPSTLEIMDQIGLSERLHQIPHGEMRHMTMVYPGGRQVMARLGDLKTKFPYIMTLHQATFLAFLVEEAKKYPTFRLVFGANVSRLVEEASVVRGVRYQLPDETWNEVRAPLTVAADGRFSKIRKLVGFEPIKTAPPMDVAWFRLPKKPDEDHDGGELYLGRGHFAVVLDRGDEWQIGYVILKGSYAQLRAEGIDALRRSVAELIPVFADRVDTLQDFKQVTILAVESSRLKQWHKPGLLLIGDAAHVMSPVGGIGINYAIQDAVETSNILGAALLAGAVTDDQLQTVQNRRVWPVLAAQRFQAMLQDKLVAPALTSGKSFQLPFMIRFMLKLPILRALPARMIAFGVRRVRVER